MARKSTRAKRILLIVGIVVAIGATAGGVRVARRIQFERAAAQAGIDGRAALERGEFQAAADGIGIFLHKFPEKATAEDYLGYARARQHLVETDGSHIVESIASLRMATRLDPTSKEARRELLDLYTSQGYVTEALELVDSMLPSSGKADIELLRMKYELLVTLKQGAKALEVAKRWIETAPDDVVGYFAKLNAHALAGTPAAEIESWVEDVVAAHPSNDRFELLRAAILGSRGESDKAEKILARIVEATAPTDDPRYVKLLLSQLDAASHFDDAVRVLERVVESKDPSLRRELVRRLWYAGRNEALAAHIARGGARVEETDPEVLAFEVLALRAAGKASDAAPMIATLAASSEPAAKLWTSFVALADGKSTPNERLTLFLEGIRIAPDSALLRQAVGDTYALIGEPDLAIGSWTAAAARAPSWARPLRQLAVALCAHPGRELEAVDAAIGALRRAPRDDQTISAFVRTAAACGGKFDESHRRSVVEVFAKIRAHAPQHTDEILPIEIAMLATVDRSQADARLAEVLASSPPPSNATLLRLAAVAAEGHFPYESRLLELCDGEHGASPELATARAIAKSRTAGAAAGLEAFDAVRAHGERSESVAWDFARVGYLEWTRDPAIGPAWLTIAEGHPEMLQAQLGALACQAAWADAVRIAAVIERLHALTGDKATTWRIARARLLLGTSRERSGITEATQILTGVCSEAPAALDAHLLLAKALERLGMTPGAEEQLRIAAGLAGENAYIALERARLSLARGDADAARTRIDEAVKARDAGPELTTRAAYLLSLQGDASGGTSVLEPLLSRSALDRDGMALLAKLFARVGRADSAAALHARLLEHPDAETVESAADFYDSVGRAAEAQAALDKLDALALAPGERELVRARHALNFGRTADAGRWFEKATASAPDRQETWTQSAAFAIASGDASLLARIVEDPRASSVEVLQFVRTERAAVAAAIADVRLRPLVMAAWDAPPVRPALLEVMRTVLRDGSDATKAKSLARAVADAADAAPTVLPLQVLACDLVAAAGDASRATDIARRAMERFPNVVAPARQLAGLLVQRRQWDAALDAARAWRERTGRTDLRAEALVGRLLVQSDRCAEAVDALESQIPAALAQEDGDREVISIYLVALMRSGRSVRVTQFLGEQARRSARWHSLPLELRLEGELADANQATVWLKACAANVPPDDAKARLALARAWGRAWQAFRVPPLLAGAREILAGLTAQPDCPADAWYVQATLAQDSGDPGTARKSYAVALERDPSLSEAHNNLALLLADAGQGKDAVDHARRASAAEPANANYLDTLAFCLRRARDFDKAIVTLGEAIRLEPANALWRLGLAETLAESGKKGDAAVEAARAEELVAAGEAPSGFRRRMDRLRAELR